MRKFLFSLVCMILSVVSVNATSYTFTFEDCDGHATVSYWDSSQYSLKSENGASFTLTGSYFMVSPDDGYMIESISFNPDNAGYVTCSSSATGLTYIYSTVYNSSYTQVLGVWSGNGNTLCIKTKSLDEARTKSVTVEADDYNNFTFLRGSETISLSADNNVVPFDEQLDPIFYISAKGDNDLVSVLVNGTSQTYTNNQCNVTSKGLDAGTIKVQTIWPDEEYTLTFNMGSTSSDCFSSIKVDGVETAFSELKSSYKAGTKIVLTPSSAYNFNSFSVNTNSSLNAYSSQWAFTMSANTVVTVNATKASVLTANITVYGPDGVVSVTNSGTTTTLNGNGTTTPFYFKQTSSSSSYYFYINNADPDNYKITKIVQDGSELSSSISQNSSYGNYFYGSADTSIEVTVEEKVLDGKITFIFDDYTQATLLDSSWNGITVDSNEFVYAIEKSDTKDFILRASDSSNSNFNVKLNGSECTSSYGNYYVKNAKDGDIITVTTKASDVKYTLSVNIDSSMTFSELFSYVNIGSETVTSADGFASEYAEGTQCDFHFKDAIEVSSFTVNGESLSPLFPMNYRFFLNANTTVNITAGAKQEDWKLYVNVIAPAYVNLRDASNGYATITLAEGQNEISTSNGHSYVIDWSNTDGSKMNSIFLDDTDLTPSNEHQNNVSFSVTADGQHLYINNTAPVAKNDVLRVSVAGTACSSNITITDKDGSEIATIRPNGAEVEATDYNFSYSTQAPLKVTFYGFAPLTLTCNDQSISKTKYEPEVAEGEIGNTTAQFIYTLDNLAEGTNVVAIDATEDTSSVRSIRIDSENSDVYNLQGMRIRTNANDDQIRELPAGIYIINGKKVIKK